MLWHIGMVLSSGDLECCVCLRECERRCTGFAGQAAAAVFLTQEGCSLRGRRRGPAQAWCLLPASSPTLDFYSVCEVCELKPCPFRCLSFPAFCTHTHTLWISTECMRYMSPSSGPSDACPFLLPSPPSAHTHTHIHTPTSCYLETED